MALEVVQEYCPKEIWGLDHSSSSHKSFTMERGEIDATTSIGDIQGDDDEEDNDRNREMETRRPAAVESHIFHSAPGFKTSLSFSNLTLSKIRPSLHIRRKREGSSPGPPVLHAQPGVKATANYPQPSTSAPSPGAGNRGGGGISPRWKWWQGKSSPDAPPQPRRPSMPVISRISRYSIKGGRHLDSQNEDTILCDADVMAGLGRFDQQVGLFGVFDGHGGCTCSYHCLEVFPKHFRASSAWADLEMREDSLEALSVEEIEKVLVKALEDAMEATQKSFEVLAKANNDHTGSCAIVSAVCSGVIVTANCGDSCAFLYTVEGEKQIVRSTARHNASNHNELVRVSAHGGWFNGLRLMGSLLPTRAIGDMDVRNLKEGVLISIPQIHTALVSPVSSSDIGALVIASDGLWDAPNAANVVNALKANMRKQARSLATINIAESLARDAVRAGSDDDTSVIVVLLS